jgi:diadenosine tetraphosphate (Ap4A) HIT family hydrolase
MNPDVRTDPLTGVVTVHTDLSAKPVPRLARDLPELRSPCPLCQLGAAVPDAEGLITDGEMRRPAKLASGLVLSMQNRWPHFGGHSEADLVLPRRHATCLEDLSNVEVEEFFGQMLRLLELHQQASSRTLAFVNVGRSAGSSQPHFHGQVVSTELAGSNTLALDFSAPAVATDLTLAHQHGLVLRDSPALVYAPWAPSAPAEVRVVAPDVLSLSHAVQWAVRSIAESFGELPYNIMLHKSHTLVAQIIPRFTIGAPFPMYLGLTVIAVAPERVAEALKPVA